MNYKSYSGKDHVVTIEGFGSARTLVPGGHPFVTNGDDDSNVFKPVRTNSGVIEVVANYTILEELKGTTPLAHKVTLTVDGVVKWMGFLQVESYNQSYDAGNNVVSLNVMSPLAALYGIYMPKVHERVKIGSLLKEMIDAVGGVSTVRDVYVATEIDPAAMMSYVMREAWLSLRGEADDDGDMYDSKSYGEILEDICNLFGCQIQETEGSWWLTRIDTTETYRRWTYNSLGYSYAQSGIERVSVEMSDVLPIGFGSDISVLRGKRSVSVSCTHRSIEKEKWSLDWDNLTYKESIRNTSVIGSLPVAYRFDVANPFFVLGDMANFTSNTYTTTFPRVVDANVGNVVKWKTNESNNSFSYKLIFSQRNKYYSGDTTPDVKATIKPSQYFVSTKKCWLNIVLKCEIWDAANNTWKEGTGYGAATTGDLDIYIRVKYAGKYYHYRRSGTTVYHEWLDSPDTYNLLQYYDAPILVEGINDGYCIPLPENTISQVEIDICAYMSVSPQVYSGPNMFALTSADVNVVKELSPDEYFELKEKTESSKQIGAANTEDETIELGISCAHGTMPAINNVFAADGSLVQSVETAGKNPEDSLRERMERMYADSYTEIRLESLRKEPVVPATMIDGWAMLSQDIDWRDETATINAVEIKTNE